MGGCLGLPARCQLLPFLFLGRFDSPAQIDNTGNKVLILTSLLEDLVENVCLVQVVWFVWLLALLKSSCLLANARHGFGFTIARY